jgi:hypothetical protein
MALIDLLNDDWKFPTDTEQAALDRAAMDEPPTVTDSIVWTGTYDGADTDTDIAGTEDFTFDPDDNYGTDRY